MFQIIMSGKLVITRDSPAIRELLNTNFPGVCLIPPADSDALVAAVNEMIHIEKITALHQDIIEKILPVSIGKRLIKYIEIAIPKS